MISSSKPWRAGEEKLSWMNIEKAIRFVHYGNGCWNNSKDKLLAIELFSMIKNEKSDV
jgi:hypothetical protein